MNGDRSDLMSTPIVALKIRRRDACFRSYYVCSASGSDDDNIARVSSPVNGRGGGGVAVAPALYGAKKSADRIKIKKYTCARGLVFA